MAEKPREEGEAFRLVPQAAEALGLGKVVAYPTEAVYGLGCDPYNEAAVKKILSIKQRPEEKGLILIAAHIAQILPFIEEVDAKIWAQVSAKWPGPVTWLLPVRQSVPKILTGGYTAIALRVSRHPLVQALCEAYGGAIVSTSANIQGAMPARTYQEVIDQFSNKVDFILPGTVDLKARPSQIIDALTGKVVRE